MSVVQWSRRPCAGALAAGVVVLTLVVFVIAVALAGSVGAMHSTGDETTAPAPIDDDLLEANGTVSVLVRLEAFDETHAGATADSIDARQSHAETSQQPLEQYANATSGVHLERGFWITNAALVTVETDRAERPLEDLASVEGVVALEADPDLSLSSANAASASDAPIASQHHRWGRLMRRTRPALRRFASPRSGTASTRGVTVPRLPSSTLVSTVNTLISISTAGRISTTTHRRRQSTTTATGRASLESSAAATRVATISASPPRQRCYTGLSRPTATSAVVPSPRTYWPVSSGHSPKMPMLSI